MNTLTRILHARRTRALLGALMAIAAVAALPGAASASSYVLRPNRTISTGAWTFFGWSSQGWQTTPSSSTPDQVLGRTVSQPAAPATSSRVTATSGAQPVVVAVPAPPAFGAGESPVKATVWAYVDPGTEGATVSLASGSGGPLASTDIPAGSPAGWYSASTTSTPTSVQLAQLRVSVDAGNGASTVYPSAYLAYVVLDTQVQAPGGPSSPTGPTGATGPTGPIQRSVLTLSPHPAVVDHRGNALLDVSCPPTAVGGCHGAITLELAPVSAARQGRPPHHRARARSARRVLARASRCARGCRVLGHSQFKLVAGRHAKVKVHVASNLRSLFGRQRRLHVLAVISTADASGQTQVSTSSLWLEPPPVSRAHGGSARDQLRRAAARSGRR